MHPYLEGGPWVGDVSLVLFLCARALGYAAATALGVERVVSDRHHWYDVAGGAAIGYGAAELTWWLSDKFLGRNSKLSVTTTGQTLDVVYNF